MTKNPKKKLKHLQRRLSEVDLLIKKYTYPPNFDKQQYHPSVPVTLYQCREELLRKIRKAYKEIAKAKVAYFTKRLEDAVRKVAPPEETL